MAYRKFLVDNVICSRRFHITFDDAAAPVAKTQVSCKHCNQVMFSAENHPPLTLARDENLVQTAELSEHVIRTCGYHDTLSERTQPKRI